MLIIATGCSRTAGVAGRDVVFKAKVTAIDIAPVQGTELHFLVTTKVLKVIKGKLDGDSFYLRVHSPALSGLEVGSVVTIKAQKVEDGYRVLKISNPLGLMEDNSH